MRSGLARSCAVILLVGSARAQPPAVHHVIVDTDFALPPQDDGLALALALGSPEIDIVGVTTVAGNFNVARANADALRMLEIAGRDTIGVYAGAGRPLAHQKDAYATSHYGKWWSDDPAPTPPGGFAKKALERESAVDFMARTVAARPGEVEIIAIGPLTNVANAIRQHPGFAKAVKRMTIMGGAIASLADGAGNATPNAEFNIWVDPEAARVVFRSGIPIELSPLNVSRKTVFDRASFDRLAQSGSPLARLIAAQMGPRFGRDTTYHPHMYDEVAVASLIDPTLVKTKRLIVDVDDSHGINYGVTVAGTEAWPGAEGVPTASVQYDIDNARFMQLFVGRIGK